MRHGKTRRAHARDQHFLAVVRLGQILARAQWIPARQQIVNFHAPGQTQHIGQQARLDLRDIHRLLLLIDAGLHAIVANAVAGGRYHRVIHHRHRQRGDAVAVALQSVHLGNFFFQRAAGECHTQRINLKAQLRLALFFGEALGTKIAIVIMAIDAVMHLALHRARGHACIGQLKAVAAAQFFRQGFDAPTSLAAQRLMRYEMLKIQTLRQFKAGPPAHGRLSHRVG